MRRRPRRRRAVSGRRRSTTSAARPAAPDSDAAARHRRDTMIETQIGQRVARAGEPRHRRGVPITPRTGTHPLGVLLRSRVARPLRFALTGGLAGLLQLGLLALLAGRGWPAAPANAV